MSPFTAPSDEAVVAVAKSAVLAIPNLTSLSAMLPPLWPSPEAMLTPEARSTGEPCCSAAATITEAGDEQRCHGREHRPRVPARDDHPPEHEHLGDRDQQQREHLDEVREPVRVLERRRRVGVVEAAAVHREVLDRLLRGDGPARDRLRRALQRARRRMAVERLRHALPGEDRCQDERQGQQDVDERAVEVDPEVAELAARAP